MNPVRIAATVALTLALTGCVSLPNMGGTAARSVTVAYEDTDGVVKFRKMNLDGPSDSTARLLCDLDCIDWLQRN